MRHKHASDRLRHQQCSPGKGEPTITVLQPHLAFPGCVSLAPLSQLRQEHKMGLRKSRGIFPEEALQGEANPRWRSAGSGRRKCYNACARVKLDWARLKLHNGHSSGKSSMMCQWSVSSYQAIGLTKLQALLSRCSACVLIRCFAAWCEFICTQD